MQILYIGNLATLQPTSKTADLQEISGRWWVTGVQRGILYTYDGISEEKYTGRTTMILQNKPM